MMVIAKFLIVKMFLNSHVYTGQMSGIQFTQSNVLNLKVIGTIVYHQFKGYCSKIVLKNKNGSSDSDGGMS